MPLSKHYGGHGAEVMADMKNRYGDRAKGIFYATENKRKRKQAPENNRMRKSMKDAAHRTKLMGD